MRMWNFVRENFSQKSRTKWKTKLNPKSENQTKVNLISWFEEVKTKPNFMWSEETKTKVQEQAKTLTLRTDESELKETETKQMIVMSTSESEKA